MKSQLLLLAFLAIALSKPVFFWTEISNCPCQDIFLDEYNNKYAWASKNNVFVYTFEVKDQIFKHFSYAGHVEFIAVDEDKDYLFVGESCNPDLRIHVYEWFSTESDSSCTSDEVDVSSDTPLELECTYTIPNTQHASTFPAFGDHGEGKIVITTTDGDEKTPDYFLLLNATGVEKCWESFECGLSKRSVPYFFYFYCDKIYCRTKKDNQIDVYEGKDPCKKAGHVEEVDEACFFDSNLVALVSYVSRHRLFISNWQFTENCCVLLEGEREKYEVTFSANRQHMFLIAYGPDFVLHAYDSKEIVYSFTSRCCDNIKPFQVKCIPPKKELSDDNSLGLHLVGHGHASPAKCRILYIFQTFYLEWDYGTNTYYFEGLGEGQRVRKVASTVDGLYHLVCGSAALQKIYYYDSGEQAKGVEPTARHPITTDDAGSSLSDTSLANDLLIILPLLIIGMMVLYIMYRRKRVNFNEDMTADRQLIEA